MEKEHSTKWKKSTKARKQKKYFANAPLHLKQKLVHAHLSKELRAKYGRRALQIRKGDKVKIMRGSFKGKINKVNVVNLKKQRIQVEGVEIIKKDGSKAHLWISPSKVMILEAEMSDKRRLGTNEKKGEKKNG